MPTPLLLFTHGAGAPPTHPWMQSWTTRLSKLGSVTPFEYDLLAEVRGRMKEPSELFVVEDGDHSLQAAKRTLKKNDETQDEVDARILDAVREFVTG